MFAAAEKTFAIWPHPVVAWWGFAFLDQAMPACSASLAATAASRPKCSRSDKEEKPFALKGAFRDELSERTLNVFSRRNPSKLNTRVRFPSPAPIVSVTYTASDTYFRQNRLNTSDKVFLVCSQRSCRTAFLNLDEYPNSGPQIAFRDTLQLCLVLHSTRTSLSSASFSFLWSSFLNRSSTNAVSRLVTRRMPRRLPS